MDPIVTLVPGFAVTGELSADDFARIAALGFRSIINNRPDREAPDQLGSAREAALARSAGLDYAFVPASKLELFSDVVVEPMQQALAALPAPILAHCKSGQRSAIAWAAASARSAPVDVVLAQLTAAGFDLDFLRDDLDAQADRAQWSGSPGGVRAAHSG